MATANRLKGVFVAGTAFVLLSCASTGNTIEVWLVGSPHSGNTPARVVPVSFTGNFGSHGFTVDVEAFPAKGFAARFADAVRQESPPDLLVIDNYGIIDGITTP